MEQCIADFTAYLRNEKKSPENTVLSYSRDLKGFCRFMQEAGVSDAAKVNRTNVMAYVYELQKQKKAGATVSRNIASIRSFYQFLQRKGIVTENPAADIELPKVEKKAPEILSLERWSCFWSSREGRRIRRCAIKPCWSCFMRPASA